MKASSVSKPGQVRGLPAEVTSFVGRRHEVAEVKRLLSGTRLITLTGMGGVGKTRLAVHVGTLSRRSFPDGVWLVELADLRDPELLGPTIIEALHIRDRSARAALDILNDHLRDKHLLLILDNCEHLLTSCAATAHTLLQAAPHLHILATSRQSLNIAGEQTLPLGALPLPDDAHAPSDAVRLFVERAQAVLPGFTLTDANRSAVEDICRRLDGLPLAIELAAVRLRALSVEQLQARLDDRFALLTSGSRAALPRHQTLRGLVEWSHDLCTEAERLLWSRISVFSGGLDLEAAEAVCGGDGIAPEDIVDLVAALVEKSILIRAEHPGGVRYHLLDTIREYGRERLTATGDAPRYRRRHRDWCQEMVAQARTNWFGPEQITWSDRLRLEHGNIRAALDYCLTTPDEVETGLRIAMSLRFYWIAAGFLHEGRRWLDELLAAAPAPTVARAMAVCLNARLAVLQSDFAAADRLLEECGPLADRLDDAALTAYLDQVRGLTALTRSDLTSAVTYLERALRRHREQDDSEGVARALTALATAHALLGHSTKAKTLLEQSLSLCEVHHEHWFRSYALLICGIERWRQGDGTQATELVHQSIRHRQPFDDSVGVAMCVEVLAWIAADAGDGEHAVRLLGALRGMWHSVGGPVYGALAEYHERCEAAGRALLGHAFDTVYAEGTRMSRDQAVAYALRERPPGAVAAVAGERPSPLTRRETEVARLVAKGMSNKEIAADLVIAQRTAEGHVEHILNKLGFNSRAQIAAWIADLEGPADVSDEEP